MGRSAGPSLTKPVNDDFRTHFDVVISRVRCCDEKNPFGRQESSSNTRVGCAVAQSARTYSQAEDCYKTSGASWSVNNLDGETKELCCS